MVDSEETKLALAPADGADRSKDTQPNEVRPAERPKVVAILKAIGGAFAIKQDRPGLVERLLAVSGEVDACLPISALVPTGSANKSRITEATDQLCPLVHLAALAGLPDTFRELLTKGAETTWRDNVGWTLLHACASGGSTAATKLCLETAVMEVDIGDSDNDTPLHVAAFAGREEVARLLADHRADISLKDGDQGTPLHCACRSGVWSLVSMLLDARADPHAVDAHGGTPMTYAVLSHAEGVEHTGLSLLREAGARVSQSAMALSSKQLTSKPACARCNAVDKVLRRLYEEDCRQDAEKDALEAASFLLQQEEVEKDKQCKASRSKAKRRQVLRDVERNTPLASVQSMEERSVLPERIQLSATSEQPCEFIASAQDSASKLAEEAMHSCEQLVRQSQHGDLTGTLLASEIDTPAGSSGTVSNGGMAVDPPVIQDAANAQEKQTTTVQLADELESVAAPLVLSLQVDKVCTNESAAETLLTPSTQTEEDEATALDEIAEDFGNGYSELESGASVYAESVQFGDDLESTTTASVLSIRGSIDSSNPITAHASGDEERIDADAVSDMRELRHSTTPGNAMKRAQLKPSAACLRASGAMIDESLLSQRADKRRQKRLRHKERKLAACSEVWELPEDPVPDSKTIPKLRADAPEFHPQHMMSQSGPTSLARPPGLGDYVGALPEFKWASPSMAETTPSQPDPLEDSSADEDGWADISEDISKMCLPPADKGGWGNGSADIFLQPVDEPIVPVPADRDRWDLSSYRCLNSRKGADIFMHPIDEATFQNEDADILLHAIDQATGQELAGDDFQQPLDEPPKVPVHTPYLVYSTPSSAHALSWRGAQSFCSNAERARSPCTSDADLRLARIVLSTVISRTLEKKRLSKDDPKWIIEPEYRPLLGTAPPLVHPSPMHVTGILRSGTGNVLSTDVVKTPPTGLHADSTSVLRAYAGSFDEWKLFWRPMADLQNPSR